MSAPLMVNLTMTTHCGPSRVSTSVTVDYDMAREVGASFVLGALDGECRIAQINAPLIPDILFVSVGCIRGRAEITPLGRAALTLGGAFLSGNN